MQAIASFLLELIQWFVGAVWNTLLSYLTVLISLLPADWQQSGDSVLGYANYCNAWVLLDYGVTLFGLYYVCFYSLMAYRIVKSWIPTVSG